MMLIVYFFPLKMITFVLIFAVLIQTARLDEGCIITQYRDWNSVVFSAENIEILYPPLETSPENPNMTITPGTTIIISCHGGHFSSSYESTKTILATCNQNSQLEIQDIIVDFEELHCVNFNPLVVNFTSTSCAPNAVLIEVGFQIGLNIKFIPQVTICFDLKQLIPVYANYKLTKSISFIKSYLTKEYVLDSVYNVTIDFDMLYNNLSYQAGQVNKLLGLPEDSTKYVDPVSCSRNPGLWTPGFCFSKRPLAYRGDFVYIPQQYATYRYINVAPQWYFIDYNLDKLERNVVDFVKAIKLDLQVYTGTFGVATLPHAITGQDIELFLYDDEDFQAIPVPLIIWKLIYDEITQKATVFFVVNNPHLADDDISKNVLCNDISDQITWLTWEKHNVTKGYSYACTYEAAKAAIKFLPELPVTGILA